MNLTEQQSEIVESAQISPYLKINAFAGTGKEQPYSEPVLTPYGWVPMGDVEAGSYVMGQDGLTTRVTGVFEQGEKDVYRINFSDGSFTRCGISHLWKVIIKQIVDEKTVVVSTADLIKRLSRKQFFGRPKGDNVLDEHFVPLPRPLHIFAQDVPISPYIMGAIISSGEVTDKGVFLNISDPIVVELVRSKLSATDRLVEVKTSPDMYQIKSISPVNRSRVYTGLKSSGLLEDFINEKYIPSKYLYNSLDVRRELLGGMSATTGIRERRGTKFHLTYSTPHRRIAEDMVELLRGLGKYTTFTVNKEDWGVDYYVVRAHDSDRKKIVGIQNLEQQEKSKCIKVDGPDHLYVTRDYTVTHNTTVLLAMTEKYYDKSFLYLVFNKAMSDEAKRKFGDNTKVCTINSLAYNYTRNELNLRGIKQGYRVIEIKQQYHVTQYEIALLMVKLFDSFCNSAYKSIDTKIMKSLVKENTELNLIFKQKHPSLKTVTDGVLRMWNDMYNRVIPMTHNFYFKYFHLALDRFKEVIKYDYVLLDEVQDTNAITFDIFNRLNGQKVIVGDRWQQIYGFRGSINAMNQVTGEHDELYLSHTFRFNDKIAEKANFVLHNIMGEKESIISHFPDKSGEIKSKCAITRTNAGIISLFTEYHDQGRVVKTLRKPDEIFRLPLSLYYFLSDRYGNKDKIEVKWLFSFNSRADIKEYAEEAHDVEMLTSLRIVEEYWDGLIDIFEQAKKNRLKKVIDIWLTTAHTCKGLEWDEVDIHDDFPDLLQRISQVAGSLEEFHQLVEEGYNIQSSRVQIVNEECNLFYVALTRAIYKVNVSLPNSDLFALSTDDMDSLIREHKKAANGNKYR